MHALVPSRAPLDDPVARISQQGQTGEGDDDLADVDVGDGVLGPVVGRGGEDGAVGGCDGDVGA